MTNLETKGKSKGKAKSGGKAKRAAQAVGDLKAKAENAKDPKVAESALEAITEIQRNWNKWTEAKALQKKRGFECKEKIEADEAALKAAIEEELPASPLEERTKKGMQKLELIEMRWQEFEETKSGNVEIRKHAKEKVKDALEKLERSLKESAQLTLPGVKG